MCWAEGICWSPEAGLGQWVPFARRAQVQLQGSHCWGIFPPFALCESPEASEFHVGRTCMALQKHNWAGSVGVPVFGICHGA